MRDTITNTATKPHTTERVLIYTDITKEDVEKLTIITEGSKVPRGILLANLVYLQSVKTPTATHSTPTPAA